MIEKKTLVYFSPDCFTQVDDTVLRHLTNDFNIVWIYLYESLQAKSMRYNPQKAKRYADKYGITLEIIDPGMRLRNPRNVLFYHKIANLINSYNPDIVYSCDPIMFWSICIPLINCQKKVLGIHDVSLHSYNNGFSKRLIQFIKEHWLKRAKYIFTFSKNQHDLLKQRFNKDSYMVGMSYKDFGKPTSETPPFNNPVKLLFFGSINVYKGLDLLINALENLREEGIRNLSLTIAGTGSFWPNCKALIKSIDMYDLRVRFIENEEIPDLMSSHHFIVLPYRDATQSGPLVAALGYGLPVIAPSYGCFTDIFDSDTAVLYKQGELKEALKRVSDLSNGSYDNLKQAISTLRDNYTEEKIADNYIRAFNNIIAVH